MVSLPRVLLPLVVLALPLAAQTPTPTKGPQRQAGPQQRLAPPITVTPAIDFGAVKIGQTHPPQDVTITNVSGADVTLTAVGAVGPHAAEFPTLFGPAVPFVLPAGQSEIVQVSFSPASEGGKAAGCQVRYAGAPQIPVTAPVAGVGIGPTATSTGSTAGASCTPTPAERTG